MNKEKICNFIPVAIFGILIFGLGIWSAVKPDDEMSELENRYLATAPKFSKEALFDGTYGEAYETYLSDQFVLRSHWISLKSWAETVMQKAEISDIYISDDDYLIKKYTDKSFDEEVVNEGLTEVSTFVNNYATVLGEEHVKVMMIPTAAEVLKDLLPKYAEGFDETGLIDRIESKFAYDSMIDVTDTLKEHKDEYIYFKTDHHWTALGAYYAYRQWAEETGITPYELEDFEKETVSEDFLGTNHSKIVYAPSADVIDIYKLDGVSYEVSYDVTLDMTDETQDTLFVRDNLNKKDKYTVFLDGNHGLVDIKTSVNNGKKLLVSKDSYAHAILPFIVNHYEQVTVVDTRYYKFGMSMFEIEQNYTDVLLIYNTAQFMENDTAFMLNF